MLAKSAVPQFLNGLYSYAWFTGFALSGAAYAFLMRGETASRANLQQSPAAAK